MRQASDVEQEDAAHYKGAVLQELRWIRQLLDKEHVFESEDERQRRLVVENAEQPAKVQPPERVAGESKPTAIVDWSIKDIQWEYQEPRKDRVTGEPRKPYHYFPPADGPVKFRDEKEKQAYHGMKQAIETFKQTNPARHTMNVEGGYAWIKRDGVTICYREK